ncbi:MAG: hypothetical protein M3Y77_06130 [Actinomycetota bacterium]|nr:hypothetical protein [Actinomycetota bacterium]
MDNRRKSLVFAIFAVFIAGNIAMVLRMHNQQASVIALVVILAGLLSASIFYASHPNS